MKKRRAKPAPQKRTGKGRGRTFADLENENEELRRRLAVMGVHRRELEFKLTLPDDMVRAGHQQALSWFVGPHTERIVVLQPSVASLLDPESIRDDKGRCNLCGHKPDEIPDLRQTAKEISEFFKLNEPDAIVKIAFMPIGSKLQVFEYKRPAEVAEEGSPS